jgi:transposase
VPKAQKTAALRKFYASFTKSDGIDAKAQALVRHVDPDGVHELHVPTATETSLRLTVKQRARLVAEATKSKNRIHGWLVLGNPQLSEAFGSEMFSRVGKAFVGRFVDPFAVRAYGKDKLRRFWQRKMYGRFNERQFEAVWRACQLSCELYEELRRADALPFDYALLQQLIARELERLAFVDEQTKQLDKMIAELYAKLDPERLLQREVPGLGEVIAATVEAFVGDIERFDNLKSFAAYFGIVPRTKQTGGKDKPRQRMTKGGPNLLKKYMFLAADVARRCDPELAMTYERALAKGKHHFVAIVIVAHKLVRRMYALLRLRAKARLSQPEQGDAREAEPGAVRYRLVHPNDGSKLTRKQARAYINEHFPPKRARTSNNNSPARKRKTAPAASLALPRFGGHLTCGDAQGVRHGEEDEKEVHAGVQGRGRTPRPGRRAQRARCLPAARPERVVGLPVGQAGPGGSRRRAGGGVDQRRERGAVSTSP